MIFLFKFGFAFTLSMNSPRPTPTPASGSTSSKMLWYFSLVTVLFFIWGFLTSMNDILIPYLKGAFELTYFQSMLVQFAFFTAYFVGSLIYFLISITSGDPIARIGYKNGIVLGLLISALGAFLFYPAAVLVSYPFFLLALFILGLGFTLLQISANPYVAILGTEASASSRLNLSQGFNSLGTTLAPITGGFLIFSYFQGSEGASSVVVPYLVFAGSLAALTIIFFLIKLPQIQSGEQLERKPVALKFPQLRFGMFAIFFYVGAEVSVGSILINFLELEHIGGMGEEQGSIYVSIYWGGLMIGRFMGAISLSAGKSAITKAGWMLLAAAACCIVIFGAIFLKEGGLKHPEKFPIETFLPFLILVGVNFLGFMLGRSKPARTLMMFSFACMSLLAIGILGTGSVALWAVVGVGLFNSIMWSNIFTMAIEGLGKYKSQGSSLLVMMIIGGALLPPLQGAIADETNDIQLSMLVPLIAYLYLAFYGRFYPRLIHSRKSIDA